MPKRAANGRFVKSSKKSTRKRKATRKRKRR